MKLQPTKIKSNDFPEEQREFVDALGGQLNPFIDKLVIGFNKNFTVDDNLPFEFRTLDVKVNNDGVPLINGILNTNLSNFKGYICLNVLDINNLGLPSASISLFTQVVGNTVTLNKIVGLPSTGVYRLILLGIS